MALLLFFILPFVKNTASEMYHHNFVFRNLQYIIFFRRNDLFLKKYILKAKNFLI